MSKPSLACRTLGALVFLFSLAQSATAQGSWSDLYDRPGLVGRVFGLGTHAGELYAGGDYLQGDGDFFGNVARWDGTHWRAVPGGPEGPVVRAFADYGGGLVVGGEFSAAGGVLVNSIALFDGTGWQPLGAGLRQVSGLPAEVFALAVYRGDLYAGGIFSLAGGQPAQGIARWDGSSWHPVGGGVSGVWGSDVIALLVGPDDRLYVGGSFDTAGGVSTGAIAVWDGSSWSGLGGGASAPPNARVNALAWYAGKLHAGGVFDVMGGASTLNVASWNGSAWEPLGGGIPDWSISSRVFSLGVFQNSLYVGGTFIEADGVPASRVARWDGAAWHGFGGISGSDLSTTALAMTVHDDKLVVGGEFSQAGPSFGVGEPVVTQSVATFDGSQWAGLGRGRGLDAEVRAAVRWNGGLAAVGRFIEAGSALTSQIAFFDGNDWQTLGLVNQNVNDAIVFEGDLVVTGDFTMVDGVVTGGLARYDGTSWSAMGPGAGGQSLAVYQGQLYAGGLGGARRWNGSSWESFGETVFGLVLDMHVHEDVLYIGGSLSGGAPNVFSWDGTNFQSLGSGLNDSVECMTSFQGDLIVGGWFTMAGGQPANILARWDGSSWSAFGNLTGTLVKSLTVFQGELYAGGDLVAFFGDPADWIAKWNGIGWDALGLGLNGTPFTLVPDDAAGKLYVGGLFTKADYPGVFGEGIPSWYLAEWTTAPSEPGTTTCFGVGCPCGNDDATAGCVNSTGSGARLGATGTTSVAADDLVLLATGCPPGNSGLFFAGDTAFAAPFLVGDGLACAGGSSFRYFPGTVDASGNFTKSSPVSTAPPGYVTAGVTRHFQAWTRDVLCGPPPAPCTTPCGGGSNLTNVYSVTFQP